MIGGFNNGPGESVMGGANIPYTDLTLAACPADGVFVVTTSDTPVTRGNPAHPAAAHGPGRAAEGDRICAAMSTPVAGLASITPAIPGTPVDAIAPYQAGGYITNPITAPGRLYVSPVGPAATAANGSTTALEPGQTYLPCRAFLARGEQTTWVSQAAQRGALAAIFLLGRLWGPIAWG